MEKSVLEQVGFIMGDWIPKEASIAVAVGSSYVYCKAGVQDSYVKVGDEVAEGSVAGRTYKEEKRLEMLVEDEESGIAYFGVGYPVHISGQAGVLVVILPSDFLQRQKQPLKFLTGKLEDTWRPVPVTNVSHIESSQKKTWFYAEEEAYCSIHTLKSLKDQLPDTFLPIHRSYIVNIPFIQEISRDFSSNLVLMLKDGAVLPVSQNYTALVRERLGF
ncbi:LytR/AlgR family response regulator transcription factor [Planococcus shenhongbingii]|uniref:LytTR family DNA-binding domain-containing protein n=1 Tax=Planococcus shenhongbingii TaxID=3058398 RepID=A0ABT8N9Y2_9BACL|nr:LytTR family DNA-binding domain-containing protein [Planococcus sp. N017]MDN7244477.1 LytTR family DNA-binding domain-containing protein [Planococcus sp. N017]